MPVSALAPAMSSASDTMTPSKPRRPRSTPPSIVGEKVDGRSGSIAVHDDVRRHDARDAGGDGRPEGLELAHLEHVGRRVHPRQREVRVGHGVAVPREVLRARGHPLRLQALHRRDRVPRHEGGVGAEAAHPDDGVVGRRVDVDDGSEVEVDAECRELAGDGRRRLPRQRGVVEPAEHRVARLVDPVG